MKTSTTLSLSKLLLFTISIIGLSTSCSKKNDFNSSDTGETVVIFNASQAFISESNIPNKASLNNNSSTSNIQIGSIPFSEGIELVYELIPENKVTISKNKINNSGKITNVAEAKKVKQTLGANIVYRVLAYDEAGDKKGDVI